MMSKARFLFCLFVLMVNRSSGLRRGYYTVVAPGSVRTNTPYHVSVSLGDFHQSSWFNISLMDRNRLNVQKTVEVQPATTELISIPVPKLHFGYARLTVTAFGGIASRHDASVTVEDYNYQVYIQTDKPRYRPGELVRFRVICIDELTRPAVTDDVLDVLIYDDDSNLVKKVDNISLTQGVFKGQLQLADHTILGTWTIRVQSSSSHLKQKSFQVSRYVLPIFTVEIDTKPDVYVNDESIKLLIRAKYAHDEPVKGNLLVNFTLKQPLRGSPLLTFSREIQFDGHQLMSLDIEKDLQMRRPDVEGMRVTLYTLSVDARVTDSITRQVVEEKATVQVHSSPYKIELEVAKYYDPQVPVNVRIAVTDLQDKPVEAGGSPVTIWVNSVDQMTGDASQITYLNEEGVAVAQLNLTDNPSSKYSLSAEFRGHRSLPEELQAKPSSAIRLSVLTPSPEVGEEIIVQLTSRDPIDHFVYETVSRGNIIQAERVNVPEEATTHQLRINTTYAMVPKISLYVHRLKKGNLESALKDISIGRTFQNSIEVDVEGESRPGAAVSVNVSTDVASYVGLLGIDQRLLMDSEREEELTADRVFSRLREYDAFDLNDDVDLGSEAGLITLTNIFKPTKDSGSGIQGVLVVSRFDGEDDQWEVDAMKPRIRRVFSDGWLFADFESTPRGGLQLHPTIPDAITSWAITGFSLNPHTGLSLTKSAATLRVFQSFFISMDLPSVVREGEILEVPVYVFNYNNEVASTEVTAESQGEHLVLLDSLSKDGSPSFKITFSVSISARGRVRLTFPIKALKTGLFNVTVRATSPVGSDALQKTLTVVSEGIPHLVSRTYLVHFLQESEQADELLVNIPKNAVQGSEQIELSVVGDTFGPLMESLSNLVQVPYGNGKETTMHFISNLLVLKYLKALNLTNPGLERRARVFLETAYQTVLTLKHLDGSFSFFGRSTKSTGDALQTAVVMWALQQAKSFIQVDHNVLTRCKNFYLKPKQAPNGGFQSGTGLDDDVALTTIALLAFMEDEANVNVISRGLAFLYNSLDDLESPTSAALSKYVLVMGRHEKSQEILTQLSSRSARIRTGRRVLWDRSTTIQGVLEATSGSFLSILQSQAKPTDTLIPIVTALLSPGQSDKIPTHLMALDAMIGIARDMHFGARNLDIHFESDQGDAGDLKVNSSNVHVLQTVQLDSATRKVRIATKGQGLAVVTVKSRYNRPREHLTTSTFQTNVTVSEGAEALVDLKICVSTRLAGGTGNLTEVEVNLPSGYTVLEDQEDNPFNSHLGKHETDKWFGTQATGISPKLRAFKVDSGAGSVHAIFENIDRIGACFDMSALRSFRVLNAKVVTVVVHDVYDEGQTSTTFHQLNLTE